MKKYKIKVIKRYSLTLEGENKDEVKGRINTIVNNNDALNLPYVRKNVSIKIRELKSRKDNPDEENS